MFIPAWILAILCIVFIRQLTTLLCVAAVGIIMALAVMVPVGFVLYIVYH